MPQTGTKSYDDVLDISPFRRPSMSAAAVEHPCDGEPERPEPESLLESANRLSEQLPGHRVEIIGGVITVAPSPDGAHGRALTKLMRPLIEAGLDDGESAVIQGVGVWLPRLDRRQGGPRRRCPGDGGPPPPESGAAAGDFTGDVPGLNAVRVVSAARWLPRMSSPVPYTGARPRPEAEEAPGGCGRALRPAPHPASRRHRTSPSSHSSVRTSPAAAATAADAAWSGWMWATTVRTASPSSRCATRPTAASLA